MGQISASSSLFTRYLSPIYKEYVITERLLRDNATAGIAPFIIGLLPQLFIPFMPHQAALNMFLRACILATCYEYSFDIVNQTIPAGVAEDLVNKPYRPIPSGLLTLRGAKIRWALAWLLSPLLGFLLSGTNVAFLEIMWQATIWFFYIWPKPNNPVARNLFILAGTFVMVSSSNAIVAAQYPDRNISLVLRCAVTAWTGLVIHLQEFKDEKGDRAAGKKTLPIVLGEERIWMIRYATCGLCVVTHTLFLLWGIHLAPRSPYVLSMYAVGVMQFAVGTVLGFRVLKSRSVETDRANYFHWLTPLFCIILIYMNLLATAK